VKKRFVVEPVVAKKLVEVELVVVELFPVKFWKVEEPRVRMLAKVPMPLEVIDPPFALVKKREVLDAEPERRVPRFALLENRFVELAVVAKLLVEVELVTERFVPEILPVDDMFPPLMFVAERLVEDAVVAKLFVEVEFVVVELRAVKLFRVLDPETKRLANDPRPFDVKVPALKLVAERLVKFAVLAKIEVEVEFVVVEFRAVKLLKVDEPVAKIFENDPSPVEVMLPVLRAVAKSEVEEAVFEKRLLPVALPKVTKPRFALVEKRLVEEAVLEKMFVVVARVVTVSTSPRRVVNLGRVVVAVRAASNLF
jgi:hypothetical protein